MSRIREITSKDQFDTLISSGNVVFVDFYGDQRASDDQSSSFFKQLADDIVQPDIEFCKLDVDQIQDVASTYGVATLPTFHVYKNQERIGAVSGPDRDAIDQIVKLVLDEL